MASGVSKEQNGRPEISKFSSHTETMRKYQCTTWDFPKWHFWNSGVYLNTCSLWEKIFHGELWLILVNFHLQRVAVLQRFFHSLLAGAVGTDLMSLYGLLEPVWAIGMLPSKYWSSMFGLQIPASDHEGAGTEAGCHCANPHQPRGFQEISRSQTCFSGHSNMTVMYVGVSERRWKWQGKDTASEKPCEDLQLLPETHPYNNQLTVNPWEQNLIYRVTTV